MSRFPITFFACLLLLLAPHPCGAVDDARRAQVENEAKRIQAEHDARQAKARALYDAERAKADQEALRSYERIALRESRKGDAGAADVVWRRVLRIDRAHPEARRFFSDRNQLEAVIAELAGGDQLDLLGNPLPPAAAAGVEATLTWNCADVMDVYLDGKPLRTAGADFRTRDNEALQEFHAKATLRPGSLITVAGRAGGQCGFMLVAYDATGKVVLKSDAKRWTSYLPSDAERWFDPEVVRASISNPVRVLPMPWVTQKHIRERYMADPPESIWTVLPDLVGYFACFIE